jgi:hypothetical protein
MSRLICVQRAEQFVRGFDQRGFRHIPLTGQRYPAENLHGNLTLLRIWKGFEAIQ